MFRLKMLILPSVLVLLAAPVHATLQAETAVRSSSFGPITGVLCSDGGFGSSSAMSGCADAGNIGLGEARADYGSLGAYARVHSASPPADNDNYQAYGIARFDDRLMVGSSLLTPGQSTDVRVTFALSGTVFRQNPDFLVGGTASIPWTFRVLVNALELQPSNGPLSSNGEFYYDFNMPVGGSVLFGAELIADARCSGCNGAYDALGDFMNTATVSSVEVLGLDPDQYVFTSLEGASYANVVPEPGTALLLGLGLAGLSARSRRR